MMSKTNDTAVQANGWIEPIVMDVLVELSQGKNWWNGIGQVLYSRSFPRVALTGGAWHELRHWKGARMSGVDSLSSQWMH